MNTSLDMNTRLNATLQAMKSAQQRDGHIPAEVRIDRLTRLLKMLKQHADAFCEALDTDFGSRPREVSLMNDVMATFNTVKYARSQVKRWMRPDRRGGVFPFNLFGARVEVQHTPKGVIGILGTWNVPLFTTLAPLAFVLAAGNRAMIKPSEFVPQCSAVLEQAIREFFTEDEVAVFNGEAELSAAFSALPFDHIVLTGSTATGVRVMRAAAENLVPVTLELGGKSPVVIGQEADLNLAAQRILLGKTMNSGQICVSPDTVYLPADRLDAFVQACTAFYQRICPPDHGTGALTAIINERHRSRIDACVAEAAGAGARVVDCAPNSGPNSAPDARRQHLRLVIDPPANARISSEEIFGPVLQLETYGHFNEAIDSINAGPSPLALYYFGQDAQEEKQLLDHTRSGGVAINEVLIQVAAHDAPFGGVGGSGMGAYHGREGFMEFCHSRTIYRSGWWDPRQALGLIPPYAPQVYERLKKTLRV